MQVVRTHVPPPSSLSGCLSEMQVLLDCLRPLRRAHFTRTEVKIVVQTWILIWSGQYTSLRPLRRMSRDNVHLHPKQSYYCKQKSIAQTLHTQKIRPLTYRSNRPHGKHSVIVEDRQRTYKIRRLRLTNAHGKSAGITYFVCVCMCACACVRACVCGLRHPACKAHAPHTVTCSVSGCSIFFHISKHRTLLIPSRIQRDIINAHTSSCRVPVILVRF